MPFCNWTLHRRFLAGGAVLFVLLSAAGAALEAWYLRTTALALAEREGTLLGRHLGALYFRVGVFVDAAGELQIPADLDGPVKEDLEALGIVMLKVYDLRGRIVAATDPSYVGMERSDNPSFRAALEGRTVAKVATREYYRDLYGREAAEDLLELYVPLWTPGRRTPAVVLEVYRPWTLYRPLVREGVLRTAVVAVALTGLYFLLLVLFVRRCRAREAAADRPPA